MLALSSCATPSRPPADPRPLHLDPALCTKPAAAPTIPDSAGLVQAVTTAEKAAQSAFLNWVAEQGDWGAALAAQQAKTAASPACN